MASEMARVIRPMTITPETLVYSNVPEDDYTEWSAGTYPSDTWVRHNHRVWKALRETSKEPGAADAANDWLDGGATNRYKCIDEKVGTQTERVGGIVVEVAASEFVNSVALLNVFANSIKVQMIDPVEGVVFEREAFTYDAGVRNWWQYFFKPIRRRTDVVFDDLPLYAGVTLRIEINVPEETTARLGALIIGSRFDIGCARWGSSVGIRTHSIKEFDEWGNVFISKRPWAKRVELDLLIDTPRVDEVMEELAPLESEACVYIGHSRFTTTIAYGFYRDLMTVLSNPAKSECALTIEALT